MMRPRDVLLAVMIALIFGFNFVVIHLGLGEFPPLLFAALRFALVAVPLIFFIGGPRVAWKWVFLVGLFFGAVQFGFLYSALAIGGPAGLASVVMQTQAVFTLALAATFLKERPRVAQLLGVACALIGLAAIGFDRRDGASLLPILLMLAAAAGWATANVFTRLAQAPDALRLTIWSSVVPPIPLLALSYFIEGTDKWATAFQEFTWVSVASTAYTVIISTLLGFGAWNMLLKKYPASTVAPFALLVPVFGLASAFLVLDEVPSLLEGVGTALIVAGVLIGIIRRAPKPQPESTEDEPRVPVPAGR